MNQKHISSPESYKAYYLDQAQRGGGGPYFTGRLFQKGYGQNGSGLGNFFGSLFRKVLPFLKDTSKQVGKVALKTGANVLTDTLAGNNFKTALRQRMKESGTEIKNNVLNTMNNSPAGQTGSGRKRKRVSKTQQFKHANTAKKKKKKEPKRRIKRKTRPKRNSSKKVTQLKAFQDVFGTRN